MYMEYKKLEFIIFIKKKLFISETNYNKIYKKKLWENLKDRLKKFSSLFIRKSIISVLCQFFLKEFCSSTELKLLFSICFINVFSPALPTFHGL